MRRQTSETTCLADVPVGVAQEGRPVRQIGVAAAVLPESHFAVHQRGLDRRKLTGAEVLFPEKPVDRTRTGSSHEHAFGVHPSVAIGLPAADEDGTWCTHRNELMRV